MVFLKVTFSNQSRFRKMIDRLQEATTILKFRCSSDQISITSQNRHKKCFTYGSLFACFFRDYKHPGSSLVISFSVYSFDLSKKMKASKEIHNNSITMIYDDEAHYSKSDLRAATDALEVVPSDSNSNTTAGSSRVDDSDSDSNTDDENEKDNNNDEKEKGATYIKLEFRNQDTGEKTISDQYVPILQNVKSHIMKPLPKLEDSSILIMNADELKKQFHTSTLAAKTVKMILTREKCVLHGIPTTEGTVYYHTKHDAEEDKQFDERNVYLPHSKAASQPNTIRIHPSHHYESSSSSSSSTLKATVDLISLISCGSPLTQSKRVTLGITPKTNIVIQEYKMHNVGFISYYCGDIYIDDHHTTTHTHDHDKVKNIRKRHLSSSLSLSSGTSSSSNNKLLKLDDEKKAPVF